MARGRQDEELTQAEIQHLAAQDEALRRAAEQEAQRTAIASQEQGTRAAAQQQAAREGEAKISQEQEMTPFQQMLAASQAGAPVLQERANKIKAAIDMYQTMAQGKIAHEQVQAQRDIESGRETGALERQKEASKSNVTDALITHLATRPDIISTGAFVDALKARGQGELAETFHAARQATVQSEANKTIAAIPDLIKTGNLDKTLPALQADPEKWALIKPHVDAAREQFKEQPQEGIAHGLGRYARLIGPNLLVPGIGGPIAEYQAVKGLADWQKVKKAARDFYGGLTQ